MVGRRCCHHPLRVHAQALGLMVRGTVLSMSLRRSRSANDSCPAHRATWPMKLELAGWRD